MYYKPKLEELSIAIYMTAFYQHELQRQSIRRTRIQILNKLSPTFGRMQAIQAASYGRGIPKHIKQAARLHVGKKPRSCGHRYLDLICEGVRMCSMCYNNDHIRNKLLCK
jgi:hypothetical protein